MKTTKKFTLVLAAVAISLSAAISTALAQGDDLTTLCFRNRTVQVPSYLVARYLSRPGTTSGPCVVTP